VRKADAGSRDFAISRDGIAFLGLIHFILAVEFLHSRDASQLSEEAWGFLKKT
jgi:hypothetical protein